MIVGLPRLLLSKVESLKVLALLEELLNLSLELTLLSLGLVGTDVQLISMLFKVILAGTKLLDLPLGLSQEVSILSLFLLGHLALEYSPVFLDLCLVKKLYGVLVLLLKH